MSVSTIETPSLSLCKHCSDIPIDPDHIRALELLAQRCDRTLSRAEIVRAILRVVTDLKIDVTGVVNEFSFEQRIREAIEKCGNS
ncbi:hypothetical protein ACFL6S_00770 [Candidatus Poribacteria bacterium]